MWFVGWCGGVGLASELLRAGGPDPAPWPRYDVRIALDPQSFSAEGTIRWVNGTGAPVSDLPLLLAANAVRVPPVSVTRLELIDGPPGRFEVGHPSDRRLVFDAPVPPGGAVTVGFAVGGPLSQLPDDVNDLFAQGMAQLDALRGAAGGGDYGLLATGDGITVLTGAFPVIGPAADGAWAARVLRLDAPIGDLAWNGPASFRVEVTTPVGLRVVTNLVDAPVVVRGDHQVVVCSGEGVSDLAVVAARDWVVREQRVGAVTVRSWAREPDAAAGATVLSAGAQALSALERYGPYPFAELDLVEASLAGGAGGVEFGSLALIGGFLYGRGSLGWLGGAVPDLAEQRGFVVAHEVAHQWAPGVVGVDAWNHPVVDEALAQYLAWRVRSDGRSTAQAEALATQQLSANYALMRLLGTPDAPAAASTSAFVSNLQYAGVVYGKAPGLYRALERSIGRPALDRAIRQAVEARGWTTSTAEQWLAALEAGGATGARALGARWWSEAHGDEDLGFDPAGGAALEPLVGRAVADQLTRACATIGKSPADCLKMVLGTP
ncbi:MAG: M1 family aminopeptidase [Myxococcota bacterium]